MSNISTKPPSGMRDFLPEELLLRRYAIEKVRSAYELYGFSQIETPCIENLTTLLGKYGEEGDQLIYRILHRRDALKRALDQENVAEAELSDLGLRYDLTVPLARVVAQYGDLPKFFKRYQIQPVWRADRPSRGRFREFYQCDVDVTGTNSLLAEADVLSAVSRALLDLGFAEFKIHLNHRKLLFELIRSAGIPPESEGSALIAVDKLDKIKEEGVLQELIKRGIDEDKSKNLLSIIQRVENESDQDLAARLKDSLNSEEADSAIDELLEIKQIISNGPADGHVEITPALARGLGYYTGPIFEITERPEAGTLGGGGRYDGLVGMFGKSPIPAVGFSLGIERLLLLMKERPEMRPEFTPGPQIVLCSLGVEPAEVFSVAESLRDQGLRIEIYPDAAKLGKQLQYADSSGVKAPCAAIIGEDELAQGTVTLKALESGVQETFPVEEVAKNLDALLQKPAAD